MRLIKKDFEPKGAGSVTLFPEEPEDMVRASSFLMSPFQS